MFESAWPAQGLTRRLAKWVAFTTTVSLLLFGAISYVVILVDEDAERAPGRDTLAETQREAIAMAGKAMLIATPLGLAFAMIVSTLAIRRAIRPLDEVVRAAARITTRDLHERVPVPPGQDEVREVVLALNGLLERLEAGFAALDRFAADASHELRTPLTVLSTELDVMLQRPRTATEWEAAAAVCLDEARRLGYLVSALLDLARAERMSCADKSSIELVSLVERALAGVAVQAEYRRVRCLMSDRFSDSREVVRGGDGVVTALVSVLGNAVRYTPAGGEIRVSWHAEGDGWIVLHVDDDGPGVDVGEQTAIFEPFVRGKAGLASAEGVGLGLAVARRLCEHHGATLTVGGAPIGGARFTFRLQVMREAPAA